MTEREELIKRLYEESRDNPDDMRWQAANMLEADDHSIDFYKRRVELLQKWQSKMRDPERTVVCDIIANGQTIEDYSPDRYAVKADGKQEPVAWRYKVINGGVFVSDQCEADVEVWNDIEWCKPLYEAPVAQKPLTDEQIEALGHRIATKYTHRSDPASHSYGFVRHTLIDFARAIEKHGIGGVE